MDRETMLRHADELAELFGVPVDVREDLKKMADDQTAIILRLRRNLTIPRNLVEEYNGFCLKHFPKFQDIEEMEKAKEEQRPTQDEKSNAWNDGYDNGLADAWSAANKIVHLQFNGEWMGAETVEQVFEDHGPKEVMQILQEHPEAFMVRIGDEVVTEGGRKFVVTRIDDSTLTGMGANGHWWSADKKVCTKTGRHIEEIADAQKKMGAEK